MLLYTGLPGCSKSFTNFRKKHCDSCRARRREARAAAVPLVQTCSACHTELQPYELLAKCSDCRFETGEAIQDA